MPSGLVPYYQSCLLVWCLTLGHAFWCGASLSALPAWYLTICLTCWSVATATEILLVECRWKKDGYKPGATFTEVHITSDMSSDPVPLSDTICMHVQCNSIRHACLVHLFSYKCL